MLQGWMSSPTSMLYLSMVQHMQSTSDALLQELGGMWHAWASGDRDCGVGSTFVHPSVHRSSALAVCELWMPCNGLLLKV